MSYIRFTEATWNTLLAQPTLLTRVQAFCALLPDSSKVRFYDIDDTLIRETTIGRWEVSGAMGNGYKAVPSNYVGSAVGYPAGEGTPAMVMFVNPGGTEIFRCSAGVEDASAFYNFRAPLQNMVAVHPGGFGVVFLPVSGETEEPGDGALKVTAPAMLMIAQGGSLDLRNFVSGGTPPYEFTLESGSLRSGITMTDGVITVAPETTVTVDPNDEPAVQFAVEDSQEEEEPGDPGGGDPGGGDPGGGDPGDPPDEPEPPIVLPTPPETIEQFLMSDDGFGPTSGTFSEYLNLYWQNYGTGDWMDAEGTKQGSVPWARTTIPGSQPVNEWADFDLTALVTKWVTTGLNRGFMVFPAPNSPSSGTLRFAGRLSANPPKLTVVTTDGTFVITGMLCGWHSGSTKAEDGTLEMMCRRGTRTMGRFDDLLSTVTGTVISATMSLFVTWKYKTYSLIADVFELDPPFIGEPLDFGEPTLGLAADVGEENLLSHPSVLVAGDFRQSNVFATTGSPTATRRTNRTPLFNAVSVQRHGSDPDDRAIFEFLEDPDKPGTTMMRVGYAPNNLGMGHYRMDFSELKAGDPKRSNDPATVFNELYARIYLMLEEDFIDLYERNIKWGYGWDMRFGRWDSDLSGWTPIAGSGQSSGDGKKYDNGTLYYYKGHALRGYTGPSCMPHRGPVGWRGLISPMQCVSHNPPFEYAGKYAASSVVGTEESIRLGNKIAGRGVVIKRGKWYCFEQWIKTNTITGPYDELGNGVGQYDGELKTWIDGVLIDHHTGFLWRQHPDMGIQGPWYEWYHGGGTPPGQRGHYRMQQMVVATEYIGPDPTRTREE